MVFSKRLTPDTLSNRNVMMTGLMMVQIPWGVERAIKKSPHQMRDSPK
jgi:hypothetical protein